MELGFLIVNNFSQLQEIEHYMISFKWNEKKSDLIEVKSLMLNIRGWEGTGRGRVEKG